MPEVFYGTKIKPPTLSTAKAFNSSEKPILLDGGQKTVYRSGNIVLKPSEGDEFSNWMADIFNNLSESSEVRYPKPIKSTHDEWVHDGYVAWSFLEGEHIKNHYKERLSASVAYHKLLQGITKPNFLNTPNSSWAKADLVAWQEIEFKYDPEFMDLYHQIKPYLKPLDLPYQLVHGDISGNFLVKQGFIPAVIDFSPVWAPNGFAEGVMFVDAITWEHANPQDLYPMFKDIPYFEQFAWRGILRRIAEQAEHITWFGKDKEEAVKEAKAFQLVIDYLSKG